MTKKKEAIVPLSIMLGGGTDFFVGDKKYTVRPLKLKDIEEFSNDEVNVGPQLFTMIDKASREKVEKWLSRQVFNEKGEPMTIQKAIEDDWDLADLRECMKKIIDISG